MAEHTADIIIYGAGIAGLWTLNVLKKRGYDVLLLETGAVGAGQTLASQGIIHSGLKYMLGGKISGVARQISAMPELWLKNLRGEGDIDLRTAKISAPSQEMMIPKGFTGQIVKAVAKNALGNHASENKTPRNELIASGFNGSVITLNEPVLDMAGIILALTEPYKNFIRKPPLNDQIKAKLYIHTSGEGNETPEIEIFRLPVLMGMVRNAPFPLFAHMIGRTDKPVATITTHYTQDNTRVWYVGGQISERPKSDDPKVLFREIKNIFSRYLPNLGQENLEWASFGIDRVEGRARHGALPDLPFIRMNGDHMYAWPTKLTFAPLLADMIVKKLEERNIMPSNRKSDWSFLSSVDYAKPPWDKVTWIKGA